MFIFKTQSAINGFTLMEVLLICVLVAMTAFLIYPCFSESAGYVREQAGSTMLVRIEGAVQLFYLDMGRYPQDIAELRANTTGADQWQGPYLEEDPSQSGSCVYAISVDRKVLSQEKGTIHSE